ncbi:uncharacterized protein [Arachis hypogaea]|uniref:uncharacterized protein n=1 Tax=Arachis hypogaea TaxID=3818 RepID=UPI003B21B1DE
MEADIKRLYQMIEAATEEGRAERACAIEAMDLKLEAIQSSLTRLLSDPNRGNSVMCDSLFCRPILRFFRVPMEEQVGLATMHMTSMAVPWFQMAQRSASFRSWAQLKRDIEIKFGPSLFESPQELLFKLQQHGSVSDYYAEFVSLANQSSIEPQDTLRDCFISGLRVDIPCEVKPEPYASPRVSIEEVPSDGELLQHLGQQVIKHHLSYNAMHGTSGPASIRIKAQIRGLDVQPLIDGGSSDSFIQRHIAKFLNLPVEPAPGVRVMVGNFAIMDVEGRIPSLELSEVLNPKLTVLLHTYGTVFAQPKGLPPQRAYDHSIPLTKGAEPVKVRSYRSSWALHLQHLEMVLKILQWECLFAKLSKCLFGMVEIDYLGHTISRNGVHMKQAKVKAGYATLAAPLTDLLKKDAFLWSTEASAAFQRLKDTIISQPVLALPNFELPFELEMDASGIGIGARQWLNFDTLGRHFIILLDQQSFKALVDQTLHTPEQQKWLHKLLGFDFEIQYKSGRENVADNALSRQNPQGEGNYSSRNGLLLWRNRVVIPLGSNLIKLFLKEYHDSVIGGHSAKTEAKRPAGLLQLLPIPAQVWDQICMDFITALLQSHGHSVIMVVVDRLSKFVYFIVLKRDFDSRTVAEAFIGNVVKLHGLPNSIVSDQDHIFISKFWQHLFKLQSTELGMSFAYHPQTDGQSKVVNKALEMYLRCFCFDNPSKWKDLLPWAQFWYNTSFHSSIKMLPYKALYGRDPPSLIRYEVSSQDDQSLQDILLECDRSIKQLKKINEVDYKLNLPPEARIHDVFHVSALKPFRGENHDQYLPFSLQTLEIGPILQPTEILDNRTVIKNGHEEPQVKIR